MPGVSLLVLAMLLLLAGGVAAQQPPAQSLPEQLATCTSLLRVKQDLVCRCDQSEQLAAALLRRAEKAEAQVKALEAEAQVKGLETHPKAVGPAPASEEAK